MLLKFVVRLFVLHTLNSSSLFYLFIYVFMMVLSMTPQYSGHYVD